MQSICLQEPKRLRELMPDCSPELDSVVERMLLKRSRTPPIHGGFNPRAGANLQELTGRNVPS